MLGATGTIGRATVNALVGQGHQVVCFLRPAAAATAASNPSRNGFPEGATVRCGSVSDPASLARDGLCGERFDALVSCMASRTGVPRDAWAVDHQAHSIALRVASEAGIAHMVLLSALRVLF